MWDRLDVVGFVVGVVMALVGVGVQILWPDKKWIGWLCLVVAGLVLACWASFEIKEKFGRESLLWVAVATFAVGLLLGLWNNWNQGVTVFRIMFALVCLGAIFTAVAFFARSGSENPARETKPNLIEIRGRKFTNERVQLDGYRYTDCTFNNVTFIYDGGWGDMTHNEISGSIWMASNSPLVISTLKVAQGLGMISKDIPIEQRPKPDGAP